MRWVSTRPFPHHLDPDPLNRNRGGGGVVTTTASRPSKDRRRSSARVRLRPSSGRARTAAPGLLRHLPAHRRHGDAVRGRPPRSNAAAMARCIVWSDKKVRTTKSKAARQSQKQAISKLPFRFCNVGRLLADVVHDSYAANKLGAAPRLRFSCRIGRRAARTLDCFCVSAQPYSNAQLRRQQVQASPRSF